MKRKWIILIIVAVVCVTGYLYLHIRKSKDFEPQIKTKLAELVKKASNGLYDLDMENVEIDITNFSVTAENVTLTPDSLRAIELEKMGQLSDNIYTISLKKLSIHGLSPLDLIKGNDIDINNIVLDSADVKIFHKTRASNNKDTGNLYSKIVPAKKSWRIQDLLLQNMHLTIQNADKKNKLSVFKNLSASFTDIRIDSTTQNDTTRFLFARDAVIFLKGYSSPTNDKLYNFSIDSIAIKPQHDSLSAFNIRLRPIGTKDEFSKKLPYLKDRYDLVIKRIFVKNTHWWNLLAGDGFYGDEMKIQGGHLEVYEDLRLPKGPKRKEGTYPQQLLMKISLPMSFPKISVNGFEVTYAEFNTASGKQGSVTFNDIEGEIYHFSNIPEVIAYSPVIKVNTRSRLMNAGLLKADFTFDMRRAGNGDFTAKASLGNMDGKVANSTAEALGLFTIKNGTVDKLDADITGSNAKAEGTIMFVYHDLEVEFLRKNGEGDIKDRGLLSFLANNLVLKRSNPSGNNETRIKHIVTGNADGSRTFFNIIWKTIGDGMLITAKGKYTLDRLLHPWHR